MRRSLALGYMLIAVAAPLMVFIFPGEPALSINHEVLRPDVGHLPRPGVVLGQGAERYDERVFDGLAGNVDSVAADYPDGSNAVVALFDGEVSAHAALGKLKELVPHQREEKDLWATHFTADSGDYVMLSRLGQVLVMIISEREPLARQRLAALPALHYNSRPGLGAVLQQQSGITLLLILFAYVAVQWLCVRLLLHWAASPVAATAE